MKKTLEQEANEYAHNYFEMHETNHYKALNQGFIAGANSNYVKRQIIEARIDALNNLNIKLIDKYNSLTDMQQKVLNDTIDERLTNKKSGVRLALEEIRRDINELKQQLKELEDE